MGCCWSPAGVGVATMTFDMKYGDEGVKSQNRDEREGGKDLVRLHFGWCLKLFVIKICCCAAYMQVPVGPRPQHPGRDT